MPNCISSIQSEESPEGILKSLALKKGYDIFSSEFAKFLDETDPLASFRRRFCYPKKRTLPLADKSIIEDPEEECIYFCGSSLGLKPKEVDQGVNEQLQKWGDMGVQLHYVDPLPAASCDNYGRESIGRLLGADPESVVLMNGLTVNLHLLMISFYQPTKERFKILIEKNAFPSDRYAVRSQASIRGFDPTKAILEVAPRPNEHILRVEDIIELINREGDSIAVVCLSGVQYYTGQLFDMDLITKAAQAKGCYVGWDLAHAIGNVQLRIDDWNVDFACWCNYKYLNSGAGTIGGAYINKRNHGRNVPHLQGWWSNRLETRFLMQENCDLAEGVEAFKLCNPSPIMISCVLASLKIFDEARMERILRKQFMLTGYLEYLLSSYFGSRSVDSPIIEIITPRDPNQRGAQLSLNFYSLLKRVYEELQKRGVVCDVRLPNVMRITPVPLYNSFSEVYHFVQILREIFQLCKSDAA